MVWVAVVFLWFGISVVDWGGVVWNCREWGSVSGWFGEVCGFRRRGVGVG